MFLTALLQPLGVTYTHGMSGSSIASKTRILILNAFRKLTKLIGSIRHLKQASSCTLTESERGSALTQREFSVQHAASVVRNNALIYRSGLPHPV